MRWLKRQDPFCAAPYAGGELVTLPIQRVLHGQFTNLSRSDWKVLGVVSAGKGSNEALP
jgi:hypothetical protein